MFKLAQNLSNKNSQKSKYIRGEFALNILAFCLVFWYNTFTKHLLNYIQ